MNPGWFNLLGLSRRAGKLAPGENQVTLAIKRHQAVLVIIAEDAGAAVYRKYHLWTQDLGIPLVKLGTKVALGHAIGMGPHAVLAILDQEFGGRILEEMRKSSGGIILDRKRERQDSGIRTSQRAETRQSASDRPVASATRRKHQKPHEHGRAGGGPDSPQHHGGQVAPRATQTRAKDGGSPTRSATSADGRPKRRRS